MSLMQHRAEEFFAEPHVALLMIPGPAAPLTMPVWYDYQRRQHRLVTGPDSLAAKRLREAGRCTLVVDSVTPPPRYVAVECTLIEEGEPSLEAPRSVAARYLPPHILEGYLTHIEQNVGPEVRFTLRPVTWRSAGIG